MPRPLQPAGRSASNETRDVTQKLANALRRGAGVQGRWGEETLRNVLQAAGLTRFDFIEQHNLDTDEGRRRPDVVVRMPGDSELEIEVDAREHSVTFVIKDKRTGEVLREVPEGDAQNLMEQLREHHGVLVDRSL